MVNVRPFLAPLRYPRMGARLSVKCNSAYYSAYRDQKQKETYISKGYVYKDGVRQISTGIKATYMPYNVRKHRFFRFRQKLPRSTTSLYVFGQTIYTYNVLIHEIELIRKKEYTNIGACMHVCSSIRACWRT